MSDVERLMARIDALEARSAHQERTIEELNQAVIDQWKLIDGLKRQVGELKDRIREAADATPTGPEPPPPHY